MNRSVFVCGAALVVCGGLAAAQEQHVRHDGPMGGATFHMQVDPPGAGTAAKTFQFVYSEAGIAGKTVKGAPYSATAETVSVQTLADGNRITNKSLSNVVRDSEGRTRREQSLPAIGPWASDGPAPMMITITDPVAGVTYMLDEGTKTARKFATKEGAMMAAKLSAEAGARSAIRIAAPPQAGEGMSYSGAGNVMFVRHSGSVGEASAIGSSQTKTEQLGNSTIEGVVAEGTRTVTTIPAGQMGNDRPIEITDERWYSNELQTVVMTKHSDPRMGETTFRLTKVSRGDPPRSLFEVPADYKVVEPATVDFRGSQKD